MQWLQTSNYDGPFDGQRVNYQRPSTEQRKRLRENYDKTERRVDKTSSSSSSSDGERRMRPARSCDGLGRESCLEPAMLRSHIPIAETRRQPETGQDRRLQEETDRRMDSQTDVGQRTRPRDVPGRLNCFYSRKRNETKFASLYYVRLLLDGSPRRLRPALSAYVCCCSASDRCWIGSITIYLSWPGPPFFVLDKRYARDKFHRRC